MPTPKEVADHFQSQATNCRDFGSEFLGDLLSAAGSKIEQSGALHDLVGDWPGLLIADLVAIQFASALHAIVLTNSDDALVAAFPSAASKGDGRAALRAAEAYLDHHRDWAKEWLSSAPQTNEVRRSTALFAGISTLAREYGLPLHLLELGASAGLNLLLDAFEYRTPAWTWGNSPVVIETDWQGAPFTPGSLDIRSRASCDLNPLEVSLPNDRVRLYSYIWADQLERLERTRKAVDLAIHNGIQVDKMDAADWIEEQLRSRREGVLTVVYHSIFYQYPSQELRKRIQRSIVQAGERATKSAPLAWLRFEFEAAIGGPMDSKRCILDAITWPDAIHRKLADVDSHGRAVTWLCEEARDPRTYAGI